MLKLKQVPLVVAIELPEPLIVMLALHLELARQKERVLLYDRLVLLLLPSLLELERGRVELPTATWGEGEGEGGVRVRVRVRGEGEGEGEG